MARQRTIGREVGAVGVGLHTGQHARVTLCPAWPDCGLLIHRDVPEAVIPVCLDSVAGTAWGTSLGDNRATVATAEHLLAALVGLGVNNLRIEVEGPEVPLLDGSAAPWVDLVRSAGVVDQDATLPEIIVREAVRVGDASRWVEIAPFDGLALDYAIDFPAAAARHQRFAAVVEPASFATVLAPARTFGLLSDLPGLKAAGLARGASLDSCIVLDGERVLSGPLRFPDEPARHKALDLLGDLALLEYPLRGRVTARRAGHALHHEALHALLGRPEAWALVDPDRVPALSIQPADLDDEQALA